MRSFIFLLCTFSFLAACESTEREQKLKKKEAELNQREQQLTIRETELAKKEKRIDSALNEKISDTLSFTHPTLPGMWTVVMHCTQTNCPGFAVGDIKTEQWQFSYKNNTIIAEAYSNNTLVRVYNGTYTGNKLQLFAQLNEVNEQTTKMTVSLQEVQDNEMEGQRQIERTEGCSILYALELKKQ
jgi:hypothetical protein